jgi:hypothetical protein
LETRSSYNSCLEQDIDAIPTAMRLYSTSPDRMQHKTILSGIRVIFKSHILPVSLPLSLFSGIIRRRSVSF